MKYKKTAVISGGIVLLVALVAGGLMLMKHHSTAADASENTDTAVVAVSALVKTKKIAQQLQDTNLQVFGDVLSGKIVSLSFTQAGQVTALSVLVGQQVQQGDTLATLSIDPNAQAAYAQALSTAKFAGAEVLRTEELFGLKMVTQTQLDTARKQLQDAESVLATQKKLGGDMATVKLIAPVDGVVLALAVAQGDRPAAGTTVLQLGTSKTVRIQLGIEPGQAHLAHAGMKVALSTIQDPTQVVNARIGEVQHVVDAKTQLMTATLVLPASAAGNIVAGMRVQGLIDLGQQQVWLAPRQSVLNDDQGWFVFQVSAGKAHRIKVSKVLETPTQIGINGAIHPDWPLVVLGNYELEDEMAVRESGQ